jgi:hypothetical protein
VTRLTLSPETNKNKQNVWNYVFKTPNISKWRTGAPEIMGQKQNKSCDYPSLFLKKISEPQFREEPQTPWAPCIEKTNLDGHSRACL